MKTHSKLPAHKPQQERAEDTHRHNGEIPGKVAVRGFRDAKHDRVLTEASAESRREVGDLLIAVEDAVARHSHAVGHVSAAAVEMSGHRRPTWDQCVLDAPGSFGSVA